MDAGSAVLLGVFCVAGVGIWAFFMHQLFTFVPVVLEGDERVIARTHASHVVDGWFATRSGQLILTNKRVVWTPSRLNQYGELRQRSIPLTDVEECVVGPLIVAMQPLIVIAQGHKFVFWMGWGLPLWSAARWNRLVTSQVAETRAT